MKMALSEDLITSKILYQLFNDVCVAFDGETQNDPSDSFDVIRSTFAEFRKLVYPGMIFYLSNIHNTIYHRNIMASLQHEHVRKAHPEFSSAYLTFAQSLKQYVDYVQSTLGGTGGYVL